MRKEITVSMTQGKPEKLLFKFLLPLIVSGLIQQLYSIVDSIIAGKFVSTDALAAVGLAGNSVIIFMILSGGLGFGGSILISQALGRKDWKTLKAVTSTLMIFSIIVGTFISIFGEAIGKWYLIKLNTPENLFRDALVYFRIYTGGMCFIMFYEIMIFIFTSLGDSMTPLLLLILSSVLNIIMDLVFVLVFHINVAGLALATVLAQVIASLIAFFLLMKRYAVFSGHEAGPVFSFSVLKDIIRLSVPSSLQQAVASFGIVAVQVLVNRFGSDIMAGFTAANRLQAFFMVPFTNLAQASAIFTAQNYGGGFINRIQEGKRAAVKLAAIFYLPILLLILFFGRNMIGLFLDSSAGAAVGKAGSLYLTVTSPFYIVAAYKYICDGILRGYGEMRLFLISSISDFAVRISASVILVHLLKQFAALPAATAIGWISGAFVSYKLLSFHKKSQSL